MTITQTFPRLASTSEVAADRGEPRWTRPALIALLLASAVLYLWGLGANGWANDYYAAAAQAGTQDWKAWLFGSLDSGNAITVDKPPAALWVMALSGRLFGFSAFTMLLPQALMGVGSVAVLYAAVRRASDPVAGVIAAAALAVTPVAALMFRFNNPDALLVLLMVVAAYCVVRATETASTRWMALAGCALGFAFLTKMLQAFLVVPGLALAFVIAAPVGMWRRIGKLAIGALAMVVSAGWYIALVELWPARSRPYIGGSTDNSLLQLALGYNGIERIAGGGGPGGPPPAPGPGGPGFGHNLFFGGEPGVGRMFGEAMGAQASWLLPAALIGLLAGLWFTRHSPRTSPLRAALVMWGGWLLVTGAVFSFMDGIIHPYYTVALAPAVAALVGLAASELWRGKEFLASRMVLGVMSAVTGVWVFILLDRTPQWWPALRWVVLVVSVVAAAMMVVGAHRLGRAAKVLAITAVVAGLAGPAAYTLATVGNTQAGPIPVAGPSGGHGPGAGFDGPRGAHGPPGAADDNPALENLLRTAGTRWAAATVGSMSAGSLELETGASVMSIGGFSGSDNSPTLAQFQAYVARGEVRYFIPDGHGGPPRGHNESATAIATWVQKTFTPIAVGGTTVYDLYVPVD
ncbi:glycosyltransferase family 39 protein [Mycolicibacterium novocastrense]|uniref:Glycosyltransferase family 39 protein n=1 Tax=Mycolicibacterium novocastrense TaxID=59813 RepID=A0AAW5SDI5_MYCNV|nr:glycosyltransferase family 39 protein [Mycolicibacterium novocastrense]MCV7021828.1 glycosyltransferase family 39 protein [Mycolicibacterium novocastrense]GAT11740.1 PMT family glycosyltransferase, 4-amino-4-deoxy-L-arabinose transferase [Mycolicibacterium novocastrense]